MPPQVAPPPVASAPPVQSATPSGPNPNDPGVIALSKAIIQHESGGNFNAVGDAGTSHGAAQWQPATWKAQAKQILGDENAPMTPQNQKAVLAGSVAVDKANGLNPAQIAAKWNSGSPTGWENKIGTTTINGQQIKYNVPQYVKAVTDLYQQYKAQTPQTPQGQQTPTSTGGALDVPVANAATTDNQPQDGQPQEDLLTKASNVLNTVFPSKNIGELLGTGLAHLLAKPGDQQYIEPSKATLGGLAGDVAQNAALFVGGEALPALRSATTLGRFGEAALAGARGGALAGTLGGAGNALSQGGNLLDAGKGALEGGALGGLTGGVLGGGLGVLPAAAGRVANAGVKSGASAVNDIASAAAAGKNQQPAFDALNKVVNQSTEAAGKVVQGTAEDAALAARVLPSIDTTGVKTYSELSDRIQQEIDSHLKTVDQEFGSATKPIKLPDLAQKVSTGVPGSKLSRSVNYVQDALTQLKQFYTATRDIRGSLDIQALMNKAKTTGLTPKEINGIARQHGSVLSGFNANGELASGLSKQAAENTRQGLKETARSFLKSDAAKSADKQASELIKVKDLTDTMAEKVNRLGQRVDKRNIVEKIARGTGHAIDLATFGGPKAFISKLFFPSGVGLKTLDSLSIEQNLSRNLQLLDRLNGSSDVQVENFMRNLIGQALK